ncbi:MAG: hypothetical protein WCH99_14220 [Verrucomicrobiota bacterium]
MKINLTVLAIATLLLNGSANGQTSTALTTVGNCTTQIVTLAVANSATLYTNAYNLSTNQIVTLSSVGGSVAGGGSASLYVVFTSANGINTTQQISTGTQNNNIPATFTGLSKIALYNLTSGSTISSTFTIQTPSTNSVTATPVNSVVIPSDAKGNVQIVLESSSDMINWIPSQAGTYGNTYSNRFFRVKAIAQ